MFLKEGAKIRGMKSVLWLREKAAVWRIILLVFLSRTLLPFCAKGHFPELHFPIKKSSSESPCAIPALNPSCDDIDKEIPTR